VGVELSEKENARYNENKDGIDKMMGKIKNIGM